MIPLGHYHASNYFLADSKNSGFPQLKTNADIANFLADVTIARTVIRQGVDQFRSGLAPQKYISDFSCSSSMKHLADKVKTTLEGNDLTTSPGKETVSNKPPISMQDLIALSKFESEIRKEASAIHALQTDKHYIIEELFTKIKDFIAKEKLHSTVDYLKILVAKADELIFRSSIAANVDKDLSKQGQKTYLINLLKQLKNAPQPSLTEVDQILGDYIMILKTGNFIDKSLIDYIDSSMKQLSENASSDENLQSRKKYFDIMDEVLNKIMDTRENNVKNSPSNDLKESVEKLTKTEKIRHLAALSQLERYITELVKEITEIDEEIQKKSLTKAATDDHSSISLTL